MRPSATTALILAGFASNLVFAAEAEGMNNALDSTHPHVPLRASAPMVRVEGESDSAEMDISGASPAALASSARASPSASSRAANHPVRAVRPAPADTEDTHAPAAGVIVQTVTETSCACSTEHGPLAGATGASSVGVVATGVDPVAASTPTAHAPLASEKGETTPVGSTLIHATQMAPASSAVATGVSPVSGTHAVSHGAYVAPTAGSSASAANPSGVDPARNGKDGKVNGDELFQGAGVGLRGPGGVFVGVVSGFVGLMMAL